MSFPRSLKGSVWHTTSYERFLNIIEAGHILPNPPIPNIDRWKANEGAEYYPFTRAIAGISLFDFRNFNSSAYSTEYPLSDWDTFVPVRKRWDVSIWIEVDTLCLGDSFVSGRDLLTKWKNDKAYKHTIMPYIEAACLSPIPICHFLSVLKYTRGISRFEQLRI